MCYSSCILRRPCHFFVINKYFVTNLMRAQSCPVNCIGARVLRGTLCGTVCGTLRHPTCTALCAALHAAVALVCRRGRKVSEQHQISASVPRPLHSVRRHSSYLPSCPGGSLLQLPRGMGSV